MFTSTRDIHVSLHGFLLERSFDIIDSASGENSAHVLVGSIRYAYWASLGSFCCDQLVAA